MLLSPSQEPERILIYGAPGAGKSTAIVDLVQHGHRVTVLDTENAWGRMVIGEVDHLRVERIQRSALKNDQHVWVEFMALLKDAVTTLQHGEWLAIDSVSTIWGWVQAYYIQEIFGEEDVNYFVQRRAEMERASKMGNPMDGNHDWIYINRLYGAFVNLLLLADAHVLLTAEAQVVDDRVRDPNVLKQWGHIGYRPAGQKGLPHVPHTVLYATKRTSGWYMRSVKDRGREEWTDQDLAMEDGFETCYLKEVAGWDTPARMRAKLKSSSI